MGNKIKITNIESFLLDNVLKQVKERKKKKKEKILTSKKKWYKFIFIKS